METSLKLAIESALIEAGKAHHNLVENMKAEGRSVDEINRENVSWPEFYAEFVARRLYPTIVGMQAACPVHQVTHEVNHGWVNPSDSPKRDYPSPAYVGTEWIGRNCHDDGTC
jgi:hypothetical protein